MRLSAFNMHDRVEQAMEKIAAVAGDLRAL